MGTVDVHAHLLPAALAERLRRRTAPPRIERFGDREWVDRGEGLVYPLLDRMLTASSHLARMDREGVELTLLSAPPPSVEGLPAAEAAALARDCNDELADRTRASDGRLGALAVLPLAAPETAVAELQRAADLGLAGAQLLSNADGEPLARKPLRQLFGCAEELGMPLVLHPTLPVDRRAVGTRGLLTTLGFVFDTSTAAARLVLDGVFERHPYLTLVLPHAGGVLMPLLGRFDYELELMGEDGQLTTPASEQLRLLHVDDVCESPRALRLAIDELGAERVLHGSDEPFWSSARSRATLEGVPLAPADRAAILGANARRLFRLGSPAGR